MVFDRTWFKEHQRGLLFLCNNPIFKYWFRWVLRIHKDISFKTKIYRLEPNCFTWQTGNPNEFTTDFRTHDKFAKRLFHAFKYIWYILHFWDWLTSPMPELNFGFDTLTVYPDAHIETVSCDGSAYKDYPGYTWSQIHDANGSGFADGSETDPAGRIYAYSSTDKWRRLTRGFWFFSTSALTASASISAATLSLCGSTGSNTFTTNTFALNVYNTTSTGTTAIVAADYQTAGTTAYCDTATAYANWSESAYNDFSLNASGISAISKTGLTRFCSREANYDAANSAPAWQTGKVVLFNASSADAAGTTSDPKLVITYTLGSTFTPEIRMIN